MDTLLQINLVVVILVKVDLQVHTIIQNHRELLLHHTLEHVHIDGVLVVENGLQHIQKLMVQQEQDIIMLTQDGQVKVIILHIYVVIVIKIVGTSNGMNQLMEETTHKTHFQEQVCFQQNKWNIQFVLQFH